MLQNFLPKAVIRKLKDGCLPFTERVPHATFLFADIVGFTTMCNAVDAELVVGLLHRLVAALDETTERLGVFKMDTVGTNGARGSSGSTLASPLLMLHLRL